MTKETTNKTNAANVTKKPVDTTNHLESAEKDVPTKATVYIPVGTSFGDAVTTVRGTEIGLAKQAGAELAEARPSAWLSKAKATERWSGPVVRCAQCDIKLHGGTYTGILRKADGVARLEPENGGTPLYATYTKIRKLTVALIVIVILLAALIIASLGTKMPPSDLALMFADTAGITHNNEDARATIEGTTSFQSPMSADTKWKANETSQHFIMANPEGNTVALAPHIYVDANGDSQFTEDECIYNPIQQDATGNITSYGEFIDVGQQIENIQITKPLDAGEYKAKVVYTAVDKETRTLCNGNEFIFDMTVS